MKSKNINNERMKIINSKVVLNYIREKVSVSRKVIADEVGLTQSTVTNIIHELIEGGYVIETGKGESDGGRRPVFLQLNAKAGYAIGIDLNVVKITCILTNFKAEIVERIEADTNITEGQEKVIARIIDLIERIIARSGIAKEKICGIGLVSAGPYDREEGIMVNPPNFPGWLSVPIKNLIQDKLNIPTYFEKDTNAAAIAEHWYGEVSDVKNLFAMNIYDIGIGGGVIINDQLFRGFKDGAANVGHMSVDINGKLCKCGNTGCLETISSGVALLDKVKSEIKKGKKSIIEQEVKDIDDINIDMMIDALNKDDELTRTVIDEGARCVSVAITNIVNLYSPEVIVMGGNFINKCPLYKDMIIKHVRAKKFPPHYDMKIVLTDFGDVQGALGGAVIALQEIFKA